MKSYFEHSQEIRKEIEARPDLMKTLRKHMFEEKQAKYLKSGKNHSHYRIGQLRDDLWILLRQFTGANIKANYTSEPTFLKMKESYAQTAAGIKQGEITLEEKEGVVVSDFCIGVHCSYESAGLLIQDFTNGGNQEIKFPGDRNDFGYLPNGSMVYFDLDELNPLQPQKLIYMDKQNSIWFE